MTTPFDGQVMLGDPSAINRADNPAVCRTVLAAINAGQILTCEIVTLELMRSARDRDAVERVDASQSTFHHVPPVGSLS